MNDSELILFAHPAPDRNWTVVGAPRDCSVSRLRDISPVAIADLLSEAVARLQAQFGAVPDFNVIFRTGEQVGHLHMVIIPRNGTMPKINIDAGFELASGETIITVDPESAAALLKNIPLQKKPDPDFPRSVGGAECLFCQRKTPATLFSVHRDGFISVPDEAISFSVAADFVGGRDRRDIRTYYDLVKDLASQNRACAHESDAIVRVFVNLTPAIVSESPSNCVVVALADARYHGMELTALPAEVLAAYVRAFQFLERLAEYRGLALVPFFNCGPAAGGTVACPHGQAYFLDQEPALYRLIAARREISGRCGVCEIIARGELRIR